MTKLTRRALLQNSALLGAGAFAAGLGSRAIFAQETARIRFAGFVESQEQLRQTIAVLKAYEAKNPGVEIVPEFTNFSAFTDKIATEAAGGNAPDMFSTNVDLMADYARRGVIAPLDQSIPDPIDLSDYANGAVQAATIDGSIYGIPNDAIAPAIFIRPSALEKAGIALPPDMFTWEALAEMAINLSKALGPRYWGLEDAGGNYIPCDIFLRGRGKSMFTPEHEMGCDVSDMADWYGYWDELRKAGGIPPGEIQALATDDATSNLVAGRAAMLINLTDSFAGVQALVDEALELHLLPNGFGSEPLTQHHYSYYGNATSIWAKSAHYDRMIDIIRFMHFDPEGVAIYYRDSGMVPGSAAGRAALAEEGTDSDRKIIDYIEAMQKTPAPPRYPGVPGMGGMLGRANQGVAFGQMTPQQAAEQFVAEVKAKL